MTHILFYWIPKRGVDLVLDDDCEVSIFVSDVKIHIADLSFYFPFVCVGGQRRHERLVANAVGSLRGTPSSK